MDINDNNNYDKKKIAVHNFISLVSKFFPIPAVGLNEKSDFSYPISVPHNYVEVCMYIHTYVEN